MADPLYLNGNDGQTFARNTITFLQNTGDDLLEMVVLFKGKGDETFKSIHSNIDNIDLLIGALESLKWELLQPENQPEE